MEIKNKIVLLQSIIILLIIISFAILFIIIFAKIQKTLISTSNILRLNIELSRFKEFDKNISLAIEHYNFNNLILFKNYLIKGIYEIQLFVQNIEREKSNQKIEALKEIIIITNEIYSDYSSIEKFLLKIDQTQIPQEKIIYKQNLDFVIEKLKNKVNSLNLKLNALYSKSKSEMNYYLHYINRLFLKVIVYGLIFLLFIFLVSLLLNFSFAINITRPLFNLIAVMKAVENGDYSRQIIIPQTNDEISYLASSFKQMLKKLKEHEKELEITNQNLIYQRDRINEINKKLEEANKIKSDYLSSMGHELKTPLNSIIGYANFLKEDCYSILGERNKEDLNMIISQSNFLLKIINSILEISKLEAGKVPVYLDYFDISELINECYQITKNEIENKGLKFSIDVDEKIKNIKSDIEKIREIILNLLSNSVKFTDKGFIKIFVRQASKYDYRRFLLPTEINYIKIIVYDTGAGIPKECISKIGTEFQQFHSEKKHLGSGLGLAIVKRLVSLLKGHIFFFSKVNKYTMVYIFLEYRA